MTSSDTDYSQMTVFFLAVSCEQLMVSEKKGTKKIQVSEQVLQQMTCKLKKKKKCQDNNQKVTTKVNGINMTLAK